ncbi:MAG: HflC protein [Legionellaceae bacterium]|nr:HflC protein [Legionellaceae bacterium]HAF87552.1 protease modulator HflC [Legionellales bacterium]|tara:strand:+ start:150 stop:1061 length:912 start_codon:yes stop_codon:yes gene_type:complete
MNPQKIVLSTVLGIGVLLLLSCIFTIQQGQQGLLLRLGRLAADNKGQTTILLPGFHLKLPFVETIYVFDTRIQTLDIKSSRIVTKEKKDVIVDYYVKWQIKNLPLYFKSTGGNEIKAENLLEQQLNTSLRAQFGKRAIAELVSGGREDLMELLKNNAQQQAKQLGIYVVDVRIKGIELPPSTSQAVYQRMRADMQKIANRHRADGQAAAEAIQATADAKVTLILAKARSDGQIIRAQGQAQAAKIYTQAFAQNKDFFVFYRSLKAYEKSFESKQDFFVLNPNTSFFDYFRHGLLKEDGSFVKK